MEFVRAVITLYNAWEVCPPDSTPLIKFKGHLSPAWLSDWRGISLWHHCLAPGRAAISLSETQLSHGSSPANWIKWLRDAWLSQKAHHVPPTPKPGFCASCRHISQSSVRVVWFEEDADGPSHRLLLQACLHSKHYLYSTARLQLALVSSVEFLSPDFLAVIMASGLQWNLCSFQGSFTNLAGD